MQTIKKILIGAVTSTVLANPAFSQEIPSHPDFDMKRCVNMGNSLEAPRNSEWGKPINVADFPTIKRLGIDTVRIPVRWSDYTSGPPSYRIESNFMNKVEAIVDAALMEDLNVILNVHHFDEIMETPKAELPKLVAMWKQIATRFANRSDNLWFETLNEPNKNLSGKLMQAAQVAATLAIRETNPDRLVILGGENWSGIDSLVTNILPPDENIIYTYHYYDPFDFTHQKATWLGKDMPKGTRGWGSKSDKEQLEGSIEKATFFRDFVKRPVFVGEFGVYDEVKNKDRVKFNGAARKAMEAAGIPWCLWSFSNTFALYNNTTNTFDKDMLDALGLRHPSSAPSSPKMKLKTGVVNQSNAAAAQEDWGKFLSYYEGDSELGKDILTGVATINPGQEIHPPHTHPEEEFLMVLEGAGTWTIGQRKMSAKAGDIMYSEPFKLHGLKNTGSVPLKFVVFKYNTK